MKVTAAALLNTPLQAFVSHLCDRTTEGQDEVNFGFIFYANKRAPTYAAKKKNISRCEKVKAQSQTAAH